MARLAGGDDVVRGLPQARLVLVGHGPDSAALKSLATRCGVAKQVLFTGAAPGQRMMAGFDMFALSSLYEGG